MKRILLILLFIPSIVLAQTLEEITTQLNNTPQIYEGDIRSRPAYVYFDGVYYWIAFIQKSIWGATLEEVIRVHGETYEETRVFISPSVLS